MSDTISLPTRSYNGLQSDTISRAIPPPIRVTKTFVVTREVANQLKSHGKLYRNTVLTHSHSYTHFGWVQS